MEFVTKRKKNIINSTKKKISTYYSLLDRIERNYLIIDNKLTTSKNGKHKQKYSFNEYVGGRIGK